MQKSKNKKSNPEKHYAWLMGADMFLAASVILCDEMLPSFDSPPSLKALNNIQQIGERCGFTSRNPDYEMLLPAVFNLKHGIELYLKAIIMRVNKNQEYPQSHDLIELLNVLTCLLQNQNFDQAVIEAFDEDIRQLVEKYYYGLYAFSKYRNRPDKNNEAERYPERELQSCYEIDSLEKEVTNDLLNGIKQDCITMQKKLRESVLVIFDHIRSKRGES